MKEKIALKIFITFMHVCGIIFVCYCAEIKQILVNFGVNSILHV